MSLLLTRTKNPNAKLLQVIWPAASFPHSPAFSHSKPLTVPQHGPDSLCVDCSFPRCPQGSLAPSLRADGKMLLPHRSIPRMCYLIQIHRPPVHAQPLTPLGSPSHYRYLTLGVYYLPTLGASAPWELIPTVSFRS